MNNTSTKEDASSLHTVVLKQTDWHKKLQNKQNS